MTHEYDDPITLERIADAARQVALMSIMDTRSFQDLAEEIVDKMFCSCVTSRGDSSAQIREGIVVDVVARTKLYIAESENDAVDQTSMDSFPASDPPSWIGTAHRSKGRDGA